MLGTHSPLERPVPLHPGGARRGTPRTRPSWYQGQTGLHPEEGCGEEDRAASADTGH